jgi:hypothetical protein
MAQFTDTFEDKTVRLSFELNDGIPQIKLVVSGYFKHDDIVAKFKTWDGLDTYLYVWSVGPANRDFWNWIRRDFISNIKTSLKTINQFISFGQ